MDLFDIVAARAGGSGGGGAPQVQSDWEQNDSSKKDYIKNRPFYEEEGIVDFCTGMVVPSSADSTNIVNFEMEALSMEEQYEVILTIGTTTTTYSDVSPVYYPGTEFVSLVFAPSEEADIPVSVETSDFMFMVISEVDMTDTTHPIYKENNATAYGMSLSQPEENIILSIKGKGVSTQVNEKYVPAFQSNWEETDNTKINYIQNKPFYAEDVLYEDTTLVWNSNLHNYGALNYPKTLGLVEGEIYTCEVYQEDSSVDVVEIIATRQQGDDGITRTVLSGQDFVLIDNVQVKGGPDPDYVSTEGCVYQCSTGVVKVVIKGIPNTQRLIRKLSSEFLSPQVVNYYFNVAEFSKLRAEGVGYLYTSSVFNSDGSDGIRAVWTGTLWTATQNLNTGELIKLIDLPIDYDEYNTVLGKSVPNISNYSNPFIINPTFLQSNLSYSFAELGEQLKDNSFCDDFEWSVFSNSDTDGGFKKIGIGYRASWTFSTGEIRDSVKQEFITPMYESTSHIGFQYTKPILEKIKLIGG